MAPTQHSTRSPGVTYTVSDTGPLISAFQSDSFTLLTDLFAEIHIPTACETELVRHGWEKEVRAVSPKLLIVQLTSDEEKEAMRIASHVAQSPDTNDPVEKNHLGEAQAIALALRYEYRNDLLLLDELAARAIARQLGIQFSGFPGVLLLAVQGGLISPEELKRRLEYCRQQGTHYGVHFIKHVYELAKQAARKP